MELETSFVVMLLIDPATDHGTFQRIHENGSTRLAFNGFSGTLDLNYLVKVGQDVFPSDLILPPATSLLTPPRPRLVGESNDMPVDLTVSSPDDEEVANAERRRYLARLPFKDHPDMDADCKRSGEKVEVFHTPENGRWPSNVKPRDRTQASRHGQDPNEVDANWSPSICEKCEPDDAKKATRITAKHDNSWSWWPKNVVTQGSNANGNNADVKRRSTRARRPNRKFG